MLYEPIASAPADENLVEDDDDLLAILDEADSSPWGGWSDAGAWDDAWGGGDDGDAWGSF